MSKIKYNTYTILRPNGELFTTKIPTFINELDVARSLPHSEFWLHLKTKNKTSETITGFYIPKHGPNSYSYVPVQTIPTNEKEAADFFRGLRA